MAPVVQQSDIGQRFDVLLGVRPNPDGSITPLTVTNKDGKAVTLSQVAYMAGIDPKAQQQWLEETELMHKEKITQLGSPNLIDREFEQWPQVTQGDWSGGGGQRVLSGSSPIATFAPSSDPTRFWDGVGLVWPLDDYIPQFPSAYQQSIGSNPTPLTGAVGGSLSNAGLLGAGNGFAWAAVDASPTMYFQNPTNANFNVSTGNPVFDLAMAFGVIWATRRIGGVGTGVGLYYYYYNGGSLSESALFNTIDTGTDVGTVGGVAAGEVANLQYVAAVVRFTNANYQRDKIRLFNVGSTAGAFGFNNNSFVDLQLPWGATVSQVGFFGDSLILAITDGGSSEVVSYNIPSASFSTIAKLPGSTAIYFTAAAGALFLLSESQISLETPALSTVDMYLLQGSSLQAIGQLGVMRIVSGNKLLANMVNAITRPASFGPYAVWGVQQGRTEDGNCTNAVFAYDVLRGRLFHVFDVPNAGVNSINSIVAGDFPSDGCAIAILNAFSQLGINEQLSQWGVAYIAGSVPANEITLGWGMLDPTLGTAVQWGTSVRSSVIDFTSASPKLFRTYLLEFQPIGATAGVTITMNVWIDREPDNLPVAPDFTISISSGGAIPATLNQLALAINKVGRKIIYEFIATGVASGGVWVPPPKMIAATIIVATGWVRTLRLDLAPSVLTNTKNVQEYCWERQGIDDVAAYNFLRQLWRQNGGRCVATWPTGEQGNWLLQDMHFESPKPFAASFRSDQQAMLQHIVTVKTREDI